MSLTTTTAVHNRPRFVVGCVVAGMLVLGIFIYLSSIQKKRRQPTYRYNDYETAPLEFVESPSFQENYRTAPLGLLKGKNPTTPAQVNPRPAVAFEKGKSLDDHDSPSRAALQSTSASNRTAKGNRAPDTTKVKIAEL